MTRNFHAPDPPRDVLLHTRLYVSSLKFVEKMFRQILNLYQYIMRKAFIIIFQLCMSVRVAFIQSLWGIQIGRLRDFVLDA